MKKNIIVLLLIFLVTISWTGCSKQNQIDNKNIDNGKEEVDLNNEVNLNNEESLSKGDEVKEKDSIENYVKLIELNKEELLKTLGEDVNYDEDKNLNLKNNSIKIYISDLGIDPEVVTKITIFNKNVDFKGAKLGDNIQKFKDIFGKEIKSGEDYLLFKYNETLKLMINYSNNTENKGEAIEAHIYNPIE